jgi:hypothetical protein
MWAAAGAFSVRLFVSRLPRHIEAGLGSLVNVAIVHCALELCPVLGKYLGLGLKGAFSKRVYPTVKGRIEPGLESLVNVPLVQSEIAKWLSKDCR